MKIVIWSLKWPRYRENEPRRVVGNFPPKNIIISLFTEQRPTIFSEV